MTDYLYKEAYKKLSKDIPHLANKLLLDNVRKPLDFRAGLTEACDAFLKLAIDSYGDLTVELNREAEKEARYFLDSEPHANDSSIEQEDKENV